MTTKHHLKERVVKSGARLRGLEIQELSFDPLFCLNFRAQTDENTLNIFVKTFTKKNSTGLEKLAEAVQAGDGQCRGHIVG